MSFHGDLSENFVYFLVKMIKIFAKLRLSTRLNLIS